MGCHTPHSSLSYYTSREDHAGMQAEPVARVATPAPHVATGAATHRQPQGSKVSQFQLKHLQRKNIVCCPVHHLVHTCQAVSVVPVDLGKAAGLEGHGAPTASASLAALSSTASSHSTHNAAIPNFALVTQKAMSCVCPAMQVRLVTSGWSDFTCRSPQLVAVH